MALDPLLQPFQLKHLTLKNRLMITSHEPAYAHDGMPKDQYIAYHEERAKAGVALTMTAGSAVVSEDSPPAFNNLLAYKDEIVPWMKRLTDVCHEHGTAVMIQLTHMGWRSRWDHGDWLPTVAPTHEHEIMHGAFPKKIEDWDIERIIKDYADAAERMHAAGLDGFEFQSYGHLPDQFHSPRTNMLDGEYNGSLENRMRFTFQIIDAMRERVGDDFIIGVRVTADEQSELGITKTEGIEICKKLRDSGKIDFLNIIRGRVDTDGTQTDTIPVQGMKSAPHLDFAGEIKAAVQVPVFHAARIQDVATARHAVATGKLDMVGMTRAHIADPHIIRKITEGREDDIRPCVGATYCLDRIYGAGGALCLHNAATGRELSMPHDIPEAETRKSVAIIGAGPGGMEAARVAADRGHKVTVFEAAAQPGGQVTLTARNKRRREMQGIIDWRMEQCERKGVGFQFNTYVEASDILDENYDVVIVATGGFPDKDILKTGNDLTVSSWDIISGDVKPGQNVLLFDDAGDHTALQAAETIAESGAKLEVMTPNRNFSPEIMGMNLVPYMRNLQTRDVTFTVAYRLQGVEKDGNQIKAVIGSDYANQEIEIGKTRHFDQVVVNHGTLPAEGLYFDLKPHSSNLGAVDYDALMDGKPQTLVKNTEGKFQLFRIGDAVAARNTHAAIYDALRLVKDL